MCLELNPQAALIIAWKPKIDAQCTKYLPYWKAHSSGVVLV